MSQKKEESAFSEKFTGGPHGLGDPEDRTMRRLEDQVFINKLVKDHAHHTVCKEAVKNWGECMEDNGRGWEGFFTFYTCRDKVKEMNKCLAHYYADKDFREECTQIYLDRRARYRATGVQEPDPYVKKKYYTSERKEAFLAQMKEDKDKAKQESEQK